MRVEFLQYSGREVPELAILIMFTEDGTHTGLLYRFQGRLFVLDLMWHERLRVRPTDGDYPCVIPDLLPEEMNDATVVCELIVNRKQLQRLPYGFGQPNNAQVNSDGELVWGNGAGLTCSTFVLALFDAARIPFIDLSGWVRRPDDEVRHASLLRKMEVGIPEHDILPADGSHVAKVRAELPCIRVRPEEAAAAGLSPTRPAPFSLVERTGRWILERITEGAERSCI